MGPGGSRGLQNRCEAVVPSRVGSTPMHSRQYDFGGNQRRDGVRNCSSRFAFALRLTTSRRSTNEEIVDQVRGLGLNVGLDVRVRVERELDA